MPEEPKGTDSRPDLEKSTIHPAAPASLPKREETEQDGGNPLQGTQIPAASEPDPLPAAPLQVSRFKRFARWLGSPEGTGVMMVILTAVIAGTGVVGILLVIQGGADTVRIRNAAEQQACAARQSAKAAQDFATTASLINGNINDAVGKLNLQAERIADEAAATHDLADATQIANRPYVGFVEVGKFISNDGNRTVGLPIAFKNYGPVPAMNSLIRIRPYINGWGRMNPLDLRTPAITMLPNQIEISTLYFGMPDAQEITSGSNFVTLCITYTYEDAKHHHKKYTMSQELTNTPNFANIRDTSWGDVGECPEIYR